MKRTRTELACAGIAGDDPPDPPHAVSASATSPAKIKRKKRAIDKSAITYREACARRAIAARTNSRVMRYSRQADWLAVPLRAVLIAMWTELASGVYSMGVSSPFAGVEVT
jgi:hypothetical protein